MDHAASNSDTALPPPEEWYDTIFEAQTKSPTLRRIWAEVYGDDYPVDADPMSFVTLTDLERIAHELQVSSGHAFADLGCGRGGPGLWVAQQTGATLIGIDISAVAVRHAQSRVLGVELQSRVRFQHGTFAATELNDASLDGVMSADALLFAPDHRAACREVARILRPSARFVFTSWELFRPSVSLGLMAVPDYRPVLAETGFEVEIYEETPNWEPRMRAIFAGIVAAKDHLREEMGEAGATRLHQWALSRPSELADSRRVFVAAHLQPAGTT